MSIPTISVHYRIDRHGCPASWIIIHEARPLKFVLAAGIAPTSPARAIAAALAMLEDHLNTLAHLNLMRPAYIERKLAQRDYLRNLLDQLLVERLAA